ncbi:hypothetical protein PYW07_011482 [Mythimna separata]|uniref:Reverse transcriptase domain-containing protein n=1 Tax=Mythimna separata TaxID=271217 RepID=A0AAD8DM09_MYTSE|nr:hypothetical protein PYW07_011482 [Mythimna separata]
MYHDSMSSVQTAVGKSNVFPISVGVHQGLVLSPFLFNVVLVVVTNNIQDQPPWLMMHTDDIAFKNKAHLERKVNIWKDTLENGGQGVNVAKNEYMSCGSTDSNIIRIGSDWITKSDTFRYLGSMLHKSGNVDYDV